MMPATPAKTIPKSKELKKGIRIRKNHQWRHMKMKPALFQIPGLNRKMKTLTAIYQPFSLRMKDRILYLYRHFEGIKIQRSVHTPDI